MLWEFSSAVTPGIVGGTGVALYILNKEGLSVGKSTSTVMLTALFDQLFYMMRCGFNAMAMRDDQDLDLAVKGFETFSTPYQGDVNDPRPLFRRR